MCGTPSTCYHQRRAQPNKKELPWRKSSQSTMIIFKWVVIIDIASIIIIITTAIFNIIVFTNFWNVTLQTFQRYWYFFILLLWINEPLKCFRVLRSRINNTFRNLCPVFFVAFRQVDLYKLFSFLTISSFKLLAIIIMQYKCCLILSFAIRI